jgi:hypothetical protein
MNRHSILTFASAALITASLSSTDLLADAVYECSGEDGRSIFTDRPCSTDAQRKIFKPATPVRDAPEPQAPPRSGSLINETEQPQASSQYKSLEIERAEREAYQNRDRNLDKSATPEDTE